MQSLHAIADFICAFPSLTAEWKRNSNSIISLSTTDENSLNQLIERFEKKGIPFISFQEPDIDNQTTSICVYGTPEVRRSLSNLPLCLKEKKEVATV